MASHRAFIALGSNLGDRVRMIEQACKLMERKMRILRTSSLWETQPMYVLDQPEFVNGVCEVETRSNPLELLDELQSIERDMGRQKLIDKGPRNIDLDILLYDNETFDHPRLTIPHKGLHERDFVLRPLSQLSDRFTSTANLRPVTPFAPGKTHIMAILNLTPDSFSDGGKNTFETAVSTAKRFEALGASIIDVGGQSTRPGAEIVTVEEEIRRVVPAIKQIRQQVECSISVDTFRAPVAEEAVRAGADIINDVSAGLLDPDMLRTAAQLDATIVLNHMRGTPKTMRQFIDYPEMLNTIAQELAQRVTAAEAAGIRRWKIVLDPGIGFAKGQRENLMILRDLAVLRRQFVGLPWLVGASRKTFLGKITGQEAPNRDWATAATVAAAVQGGADIIRVHNVEAMRDVVAVSDAIWRHSIPEIA